MNRDLSTRIPQIGSPSRYVRRPNSLDDDL
jgi:hypothetical protein